MGAAQRQRICCKSQGLRRIHLAPRGLAGGLFRATVTARPVNRHYTFVGGIHLCLGAHLARRELRILIDEFVKRVPAFTVKPGADTTVVPGLLSIRNLPIVWTPAA